MSPHRPVVPRNITVMLGGTSAEREVSLRTGIAVARALRPLGHTVWEVDPQTADWSVPRDTHVVFLALHGTFGEDGTIQDLLDTMGLPYTGSGAEASRLAFNKQLAKQRFLQAGVPTPRSVVLNAPDAPMPADFQPPLVLKPVCQGSSVGLQFVDRADQWPAALAESLRHDHRVLVEERIQGRELTAGILNHQALPLVEIRPRKGAYDYHNKYTPGATEYLCPAPLDEAAARRIQDVALRAFDAVGGRDYGRVDIMLDAKEQPWVLEINTLPGMTETSLLPKAAAAAGLSYATLCDSMVELALQRARASP